MYSMVPQKVWVVASPYSDSLLSPKSVKTTCPLLFNMIFSGFRSLGERDKRINIMSHTETVFIA